MTDHTDTTARWTQEQADEVEQKAAQLAEELSAFWPEKHPSWCKCQRVCGGDQ